MKDNSAEAPQGLIKASELEKPKKIKGDRYKCAKCGEYYSRFTIHVCDAPIYPHPPTEALKVVPDEPIKKKRGRPVGWRKVK